MHVQFSNRLLLIVYEAYIPYQGSNTSIIRIDVFFTSKCMYIYAYMYIYTRHIMTNIYAQLVSLSHDVYLSLCGAQGLSWTPSSTDYFQPEISTLFWSTPTLVHLLGCISQSSHNVQQSKHTCACTHHRICM